MQRSARSGRSTRKMSRRQALQLAATSSALTEPLQAVLRRVKQARAEGLDPFAGLSLSELMPIAIAASRVLPTTMRTERVIVGLPTPDADSGDTGRAEAQREVAIYSREEAEAYLLGREQARESRQRSSGKGR